MTEDWFDKKFEEALGHVKPRRRRVKRPAPPPGPTLQQKAVAAARKYSGEKDTPYAFAFMEGFKRGYERRDQELLLSKIARQKSKRMGS